MCHKTVKECTFKMFVWSNKQSKTAIYLILQLYETERNPHSEEARLTMLNSFDQQRT